MAHTLLEEKGMYFLKTDGHIRICPFRNPIALPTSHNIQLKGGPELFYQDALCSSVCARFHFDKDNSIVEQTCGCRADVFMIEKIETVNQLKKT